MPRYAHTKAQTERARGLRKTATRSEARLWLHLRNAGVGASFRRQHPIGPYLADYTCPALKIAVEVDGDGHNRRRDAERDRFMTERGWIVLRFNAHEALHETEACFLAIRDGVRMRKAELASHA